MSKKQHYHHVWVTLKTRATTTEKLDNADLAAGAVPTFLPPGIVTQ